MIGLLLFSAVSMHTFASVFSLVVTSGICARSCRFVLFRCCLLKFIFGMALMAEFFIVFSWFICFEGRQGRGNTSIRMSILLGTSRFWLILLFWWARSCEQWRGLCLICLHISLGFLHEVIFKKSYTLCQFRVCFGG